LRINDKDNERSYENESPAVDRLKSIDSKIICDHCGDTCKDDSLEKDGKFFCCSGCLFVYDLLSDKGMDDFYAKDGPIGIKPLTFKQNEFEYLDEKKIVEKLINYSIQGNTSVTFFIPEVYCSACIWLLENLNRLDSSINESRVNFLKKEVTIDFNESTTSLRKVVELLTSIGYKPSLNYSDMEDTPKNTIETSLYIKLGIAGFAFANLMLFAFPEYLSLGALNAEIKSFLSYLNMFLALPVMYSASDYFRSAFKSLSLKKINIDVPISLGIATLFLRSIWEITSGTGVGYIDSMSGLVFFLLIGKVFQRKTFHSISFDRDYKSYFPLSVIRQIDGEEEYVSINELEIGDNIIIRDNEVIPADSIILNKNANIDYSFVTGESHPVEVQAGEKLYAGGKHRGASIRVSVVKKIDQSYLTELWNRKVFDKNKSGNISELTDLYAKYFTFATLIIAFISFLFWLQQSLDIALNAFTSTLIVACPCALALTTPFTYGTTMRIFGKINFFLKNGQVVEVLSKINTIIFDKTGTLTELTNSKIEYQGQSLSSEDQLMIKSLAKQSTHPLSRLISDSISAEESYDVSELTSIPGKGIQAMIDGRIIKIGKKDWVSSSETQFHKMEFNVSAESLVNISIDNELLGYYSIKAKYRNKVQEVLKKLLKKYSLTVLSGDKDDDKTKLERMTEGKAELKFNQMPSDKLNYVQDLMLNKNKVLMIGDGLNDAGALKQSDVGIAVTDQTSNFTPGSDAILVADNIKLIPSIMKMSRRSMHTVYISFIISFLYNFIGFGIAVQGILSPVIAAILMPVSSISVVLFTVGKVQYDSYKLGLRNK